MNPINNLPVELIYEILLRLPVKSLLRFKSVCKQWLGIITSTSFVHDHYHHETNLVRLLVNWSGERGENEVEGMEPIIVEGFSLFMDENLERHEEPDHIQLPGPFYRMEGPCNGIFCVISKHDELALWNPSTNKFSPLHTPERFENWHRVGLWADPVSDEFKIVIIHISPHFSIYTSSDDSWRYLENVALPRGNNLGCRRSSKGFSYWINYETRSTILAFDMCKEVFQEIETPKSFGTYYEVRLVLLDDSLALSYIYEDIQNSEDWWRVDIWVMKEQGCWMKSFTFRLPDTVRYAIGFWTRKFFLYWKWDDSGDNEELWMYDLHSGSKRIVTVPFAEDTLNRDAAVYDYKGSLFSVKGRNRIQDYETQSEVCREFFAHP